MLVSPAMPRAPLPTSLADLVAGTPVDAIARLTDLAEALPTCNDPSALAALARSVPEAVADLAPEVSLALHGLVAALVAHRPSIPRDLDLLEPRLRLAWRRVQLAVGDLEALARLSDLELLQVACGWSFDEVLELPPLLRRMVGAGDVRLRAQALAAIAPAVRRLALTSAEAFALLVPLAGDADPELRADALASLCEGWVRGLAPAAERERLRLVTAALRDDSLVVVRAAIAAAAALGLGDELRALAQDDGRPPPARVDALDALGPLARDEDIDLALSLATHAPLRFAPATRRFLLAAHRHGVFVRAHHLDALLASFDAHPTWTAEELIRVTHIVRGELVERLGALEPDDPRWLRRAGLLAASVGTRAPQLLRERLAAARDLAVAEALIEAAGRSPEYTGEAPLLAWLDALPEVVLPVLRVKGGPQAEAQLRARVEDPRCAREPRARALSVLWALTRDRAGLLRELSARLGPHESGLFDAERRRIRDRSSADIVAAAPWSQGPEHVDRSSADIAADAPRSRGPEHVDPADAIEPMKQLELLCESGAIEHLPRVVALFREVFRGHVRAVLAGDLAVKRTELPELEQALLRYGRLLLEHGRPVRRWIEASPETGRDLVLQLAIDWLREEPAEAVCVALLELIARHAPGPVALRLIEPLWRSRDRDVRRAAIEAILAGGEGARGLELSLCRLAAHEEPRILSRALAAVMTLRARWAEPLVLAALQRPEMAVKKDAARALAEIASERAIDPLVAWLARHDNPGFRRELLAALRRAAGPSLVAVLVEALERETEPRRVALLHDALSGHLPLAAALRLARSSLAAHARLIEACLAGQVKLADADPERLAAQLHRARLLPRPASPDPGQQLRLHGFSAAAARDLLAQRTEAHEAAILATVRAGLADWIAWLRAGEADPRALALVLDAALPDHREHVDALLACAEANLTDVDAGALAGFLERCLAERAHGRALEVRAIHLLRALPPSPRLGGLRRWRLLGRLGAVRTRADLERCLDETRLGPDHAEGSAALLSEALALPAAGDGEAPELTALREQTRRWHALPEAERRAWLDEALARRPLDVAALEPRRPSPRPPSRPGSQADLDALLTTLRDGDAQERSRAAARLLDWPDARPSWPEVLAAFLRRRVTLSAEHRQRLAPLLTRWPEQPEARAGALELLPHCSPRQERAFVGQWLAAWEVGDANAAERLRQTREALLLPHVWSAAERGDFRRLHLLRPGRSLALRTLVAWARERAPTDDLAHLLDAPSEPPPPADTADPADPVAGRSPDELLALIDQRGVARGLAIRAVHALAAHGEPGVAPLERLVVDPRPFVRTAALRALRQVAPREVSLQAALRALAIESRADVALSLMRSLGHGRHEPALSALLDRLEHRDPRLREGAREALRAWGPAVLPALRRASRHARPDRRPAYASLLAELEQPED